MLGHDFIGSSLRPTSVPNLNEFVHEAEKRSRQLMKKMSQSHKRGKNKGLKKSGSKKAQIARTNEVKNGEGKG